MKDTTTTTSASSNNKYKVIIAALFLLLLGAGYYGFTTSKTLKNNEKSFNTEKAINIAELKSVQKQYDDLLVEDLNHKEEITQAKERLQKLIDSVQGIKPDYTLINKLRRVRDQLKARLASLQEENKLLKEENELLNIAKDSISSELVNTLVVYDSVIKEKNKLELVVAKAQKLAVTSIESRAVRIKASNKVTKVNRASRATGVEVCFTVPANNVADKGEKEFYIQLVSPSKHVVGGRFYMNDNDRVVNFSKISNFRYKNELIKVCDFVEPLENEEFEKGSYAVHIFDGTNLISSSSLSLR